MLRNLVLLIVMGLSAAAGWWGGGLSGRAAKEALAKAEALGKAATQLHADELKALNQKLAGLNAEFDARQQARDEAFARQQGQMTQVLAQRDQTIAGLQRTIAGKQTQIAQNEQRITDPALPAAERQRLQAENERLQAELQAERTRVAGLECSKVAVPAELLAPLQAGG